MSGSRQAVLGAVAASLALLAGHAGASTMELRGTIDVPPLGPGGTLVLPLSTGVAPVTVLIAVGTPPVSVPVRLDGLTSAQTNDGAALVLGDGAAVKVYVQAESGVFTAVSIDQDIRREVRVRGAVQGFAPGAAVTLPLSIGGTLDFQIALEGAPAITVPVRVFSASHVSGPIVIQNGALVEVEGLLRSGQILATDVVER
jgi:hypothetical protein